MYGFSFSKILEESAITEKTVKVRHLSGGIESIEKLLLPQNMRKLESLYITVYSFIAFHPRLDKYIAEYVETGSLASDSGEKIMVLFIGNNEMRSPKKIEKSDLDFGIKLETSIHPAYEAVNMLFPGKIMTLPGIVFFDRFIKPNSSVYVPLSNMQSVQDVASFSRNLFSIAQNSFIASKKSGRDFSDTFSVQLAIKKIRYERTEKTSFREWIIKIYNKVYEHKGDIISGVSALI